MLDEEEEARNLDDEPETPPLQQRKKGQQRVNNENYCLTETGSLLDFEFFKTLEIDPFRKKVHTEPE